MHTRILMLQGNSYLNSGVLHNFVVAELSLILIWLLAPYTGRMGLLCHAYMCVCLRVLDNGLDAVRCAARLLYLMRLYCLI